MLDMQPENKDKKFSELDKNVQEMLVKGFINQKLFEKEAEKLGIRDSEDFKKKVKANFKALGGKLGPNMKAASTIIGNFSQLEIANLEKNGKIEILLNENSVEIELNEVEIAAEDIPGWSVASKGSLTVALDIVLSDDLKQEGEAREFVNRVQNIRKDNGFDLTDRIFVKLLDSNGLKQSIINYNDYICREILADVIEWVPEMHDGIAIDVNDILLKVVVTKKG
jgi:isoleucyl-tRNA synthetase